MDGSLVTSDDDLMRAYVAGDAVSFETLYRRYADRLHGYIYRLVGNEATCDEIYQDTWQRVIQSRASYRADGTFKAWLFQIAHNRVRDFWRSKAISLEVPDVDGALSENFGETETPETELSVFETRRRVRMALDELPAEQKAVVLMRLDQEMTLEEIAVVMGVNRETVKSRLRYAMDKLRQRMSA